MKVQYKNDKIREICTAPKIAQKKYGLRMAVKIQQRIVQLTEAPSVNFLILFDGEVQIVEVQEIVDYH